MAVCLLIQPSAQGSFRIAHCGGYHGNLNLLISALNVVAKLLGHEIRWDTGKHSPPGSFVVVPSRTCHGAVYEWLAGSSMGHVWQCI